MTLIPVAEQVRTEMKAAMTQPVARMTMRQAPLLMEMVVISDQYRWMALR
jgi:hypothetical protein